MGSPHFMRPMGWFLVIWFVACVGALKAYVEPELVQSVLSTEVKLRKGEHRRELDGIPVRRPFLPLVRYDDVRILRSKTVVEGKNCSIPPGFMEERGFRIFPWICEGEEVVWDVRVEDVGKRNREYCLERVESERLEGESEFLDVSELLEDGLQYHTKTPPNCLFPYFDRTLNRWENGSFCMVETFTGGLGAGDLDDDGFVDVVVPILDEGVLVYWNEGGLVPKFVLKSWIFLGVGANGVSLVDIDGDGDLDVLVSTVGSGGFVALENDGGREFVDVSEKSGFALNGGKGYPTPKNTAGFSIALGDVDLDTMPDVYTTEWFPRLELGFEEVVDMGWMQKGGNPRRSFPNEWTRSRLLRNSKKRPGVFSDATQRAGIASKVGGIGVDWSTDEAVRYASVVLEESGVQNWTVRAKLLESILPEAAQRTMERDARLRRRRIEYKDEQGKMRMPNQFFDLDFVGVTEFGAVFADIDLDGFQDLVVAGDFGTTQLWWNTMEKRAKKQSLKFRPGLLDLLEMEEDNSMGAVIGDVDGNGLPDVLLTSVSVDNGELDVINRAFSGAGFALNFLGNHLYLNHGNRSFVDSTESSGIQSAGWAWGSALADLDNDGHQEYLVTNGLDDPETTDDDFAARQQDMVFVRTGKNHPFVVKGGELFYGGGGNEPESITPKKPRRRQRRGEEDVMFRNRASELNIGSSEEGRALLPFDLNNDGNLDVLIARHARSPSLYLGRARDEVSIRVRPVYKSINDSKRYRAAYGARVWLELFPPTSKPPPNKIPYLRSGLPQRFRGPNTIYREIGSGVGFLANAEPVAHFGLGVGISMVHRITVHWPALNASRSLYQIPVPHNLVLRILPPPKKNTHISSWISHANISTLHPC